MIFYKKNFHNSQKNSIAEKLLKKIIIEDDEILSSFKNSYKDKFNNKLVRKLKKYKTVLIIGMGGSILGSKAIYNFLKKKK